MNRSITGLLLVSALGVAGCTTTLAGNALPEKGTAAGFAYQLPVLKYEVESTRILSSCPATGEALEFDASVKAASSLMAGPVVVIDHEALGDAAKTTEATFTLHPTGMIKAVNVSARDHTGEIIKAGAKAVVGIGKLSMGVAIPPLGTSTGGVSGKAYVVCSALGEQRVALLKKTKGNLEKATEALTEATEALAAFDADHALDKDKSPAVDAQRAALAKAVREAKKSQDDRTKEYSSSKAKLTVTRRSALTPTLDVNTRDVQDALTAAEGVFVSENLRLAYLAGQTPIYARIAPDLTVDHAGVPEAFRATFDDTLTTFLSESAIQVTSRPLGGSDAADLNRQTKPCTTAEPRRCGIIYYTAARGRLQVCQLSAGVDCTTLPVSDKRVLLREDKNTPQFGRQVSLSLRNGPWSNNALTASFTAEGQIEQASYKKQSAEALGALGSLNDGIDAATELAVYRANTAVRLAQRQQIRDTAALNALNARTSLLTAQGTQDATLAKAIEEAALARDISESTRSMRLQKAIDEAELARRTANEALTTSQLEQIQEDAALYNALKARQDAERTLQGPSQLDQINASTQLINAMKANVVAEKEYLKAQTTPP